jgi:hypothetical protein
MEDVKGCKGKRRIKKGKVKRNGERNMEERNKSQNGENCF